MNLQPITERYSVSPQIAADDVRALADLGFSAIICNRPDNEDPGQPSAANIARACQEAGLEFHHIPVVATPIADEDIRRQQEIIENSSGKVLAYCRSGHRCTVIFCG